MRRSRWLRGICAVTLVAFVPACWRSVPITTMAADKGKSLQRSQVRFVVAQPGNAPDLTLTLEVTKVEYPFAEGEVIEESYRRTAQPASRATVDLRQVKQIEVYDASQGAKKLLLSVVVVIGGAAAIALAVLLIAVVTRTCPMLYVDRGSGLEFAGIPYAGALFRSIERDDLLPLGSLPPGPLRLQLIDGGLGEADYTDRAALALVDHDPSLEAVATPDARVLLLGKAAAPLEARDAKGRDVLAEVRAADGKLWQSNLDEAQRDPEPALRDGVEATFAPIAGQPVLELTAGTTPWIDLVFANYAALFGDRLGKYVDRWNAPEKRAEVLAWRDRQGVDLRVEAWQRGGWQTVAMVPTPGPQRRMAVALPEGTFKVRVSGGLGFWTVDRIALAPLAGEAKPLLVEAAVARDQSGNDQREALAASDGKYQVLPETGAALQLSFEVPPPAAGKQRDAFFFSRGYYNVRKVEYGDWSPARLLSIGDEPGAMARFSLELFRDYQKMALSSSKRPVLAEP
jgi:hypothetical protein